MRLQFGWFWSAMDYSALLMYPVFPLWLLETRLGKSVVSYLACVLSQSKTSCFFFLELFLQLLLLTPPQGLPARAAAQPQCGTDQRRSPGSLARSLPVLLKGDISAQPSPLVPQLWALLCYCLIPVWEQRKVWQPLWEALWNFGVTPVKQRVVRVFCRWTPSRCHL